ncbi:MAG: hypothetical protein LBU76_08045 [Azoarcus sp.]|jgi:hypothetical protein|nr:hypothetical protein [Azoarcus sp.]
MTVTAPRGKIRPPIDVVFDENADSADNQGMSAGVLRNALEGFRDSFFVLGKRAYRLPQREGFRVDAARMRRDAARVASIVRAKAGDADGQQDDGGAR